MESDSIPAHWQDLPPRQRKLFELKLKQNQARHNIRTEVVEEDKKLKQGSTESETKQRRKEWEEEQEIAKKEIIKQGKDPVKEKMLNITAVEAEWEEKKKRKRGNDPEFGWGQFNSESHFNAYKKRLRDLEPADEDYNKQKEALPAEAFYPDVNSLTYGQTVLPNPKRVDKMVEELDKSITRRNNFSRRRTHLDDAYVDYVNEGNKVFNKKIARAFDQYTIEIKQNLERGTAL